MTKKSRPVRTGGRKESSMKCTNGKWWYKGQTFTTLRDALLSAWPK